MPAARGRPDVDAPVLRLEDVRGAFVHGCVAPAGRPFAWSRERRAGTLPLPPTILSRARLAVRRGEGVPSGAIAGL